jgi:hypothetical protein
VSLSPSQSCPGCTTNTSGYDFRKGQVGIALRPFCKGDRYALIVYYVIFMIAGDFAAYFIGLTVEYEWGSYASLIVFLVLYFFFLWVSWVLAAGVGD